jgi:hypothetical protein
MPGMGNTTAHTWPFRRLSVWAVFCFAFAMIPLGFATMGDQMGETSAGLQEIVDRGDLYLISVALLGDGLGRFVMVRKKKVVDILGVGFTLGFIIMMAFEFGLITTMMHSYRAVDPGLIRMHSWYYLAAVFVLGCAAVIRTEP